MSDTDEFMELATETKKSNGGKSSSPKSSKGGSFDPYFDDEEEVVGPYTQYGFNGPGFVPTGKTIKKLKPDIYKLQWHDMWTFVPLNVTSDELLRLPDSKSDTVIQEIENFWGLKETFKQFGFKHRRGILLFGPPGGGKTSLINILMKQIVDMGGLAIIGDIGPADLTTSLHKFRSVEPERPAVVILEDIDTLIQQYGEAQILSLLDGEGTIDNVVYVATTNYPENLDGRVVNRPSRFDKIIKIDLPNKAARKMYIESRKVGLAELDLDKWAELTDGFSIAHLKELIIGVKCLGGDFDDELKRLRGMFKSPKSTEDKAKVGFGR